MRPRSWTVSWGLALVVGAAACQSGSSPGAPGFPATPASDGAASAFSVEVDLNGRSSAPIDADCARGLFVSTRVKNASRGPLQIRRLAVTLEALSSGCVSNEAQIDPTVERALAPGRDEEIRVFDAAGTLCEAPYGRPGCPWRASARVFTDAGSAVGNVDFTTTNGTGRRELGCERAIPVVFSPASGATVSGTVDVTTSVDESASCVNSARSLVAIYSERNVIVATSPPLDLGSIFRWDTTRVANGRYSIRARQNCCGIEGRAAEVTVRN
jgi:hypothetical protein